jgi:hypothetical protein
MIIKDLANKSWYLSNGYIDSQESLNILEQYINYNLPVLKEFIQIVVATTYSTQDNNLIEGNSQVWKKYFPNCILIDLKENRGHGFGIADSENALIDYCHENKVKWVCKASNDIILKENLLYKEISQADFYYTNGISYEDLYLNNFDFVKIYNNHLFPQTNFYFIRVDKIDYLYDKNYINKTYEYRLTIPNYNNKIWEYIPEWACELFLKKCIERNNLKKEYLLDLKTHNRLCQIIELYKIGDPSHKNIMIEGICHFQFPEQNVLEI